MKFSEIVLEKFYFLEKEYNFHCISATNNTVRFESNDVFVVIHYDAGRSYEVGVEIGQLKVLFGGNERPFNLGEILQLKSVAEQEKYTFFQASDCNALKFCLSRLAYFLSSYAKDLLKNDKFSFKRLSDFRERSCDKYEMEAQLRYIRAQVKTAWENKDYSKIIELYKPVESFLTSAEKKRLSIAKKKSLGQN